MGTKNDPGKYDCYEKAEDDEPIFVLRAKDRASAQLVRLWAALYIDGTAGKEGTFFDSDKHDEAHSCADAMDAWREANT